MRSFLTFLAIGLIALLTAALVAPIFIDWSAWRGPIEAELGRRIAEPVRTQGPIEIRFLPVPYVQVGRVKVGDVFTSEGARFELALMSLASGQLRFAEIDLDRPSVTFALGANGAAPWPRQGLQGWLARAAVEKLVVRDGKAVVTRPGASPIAFEAADFEASARSLEGPFRGRGAATAGTGGRVTLDIVTEEISGAGLPLKAELADEASGVKALFDGALTAEPSGAGWRPRFSGATTLSGTLNALDIGGPSPWKATGKLDATPDAARVDDLAFSLGPELRALEATGTAKATFSGAPEVSLDLTSKQLNVDALLRAQGEDSAAPSRAGALLAALGRQLAARDAPPFRGVLKFTTPAVFLGAATLDDVSLSAQSAPGEPIRAALSLGLPGQGRLKLDGVFDLGAAPDFRGRVDADVGDVGALGEWAARGEPSLVAHARAISQSLPYAHMSARGELQASEVGFSLKNLALELDRTRLGGAVAFNAPHGSARGRVYLDLSTDSLDLDEAPDLSSGAFWVGDFDLTLALRASRFSIAHAGQGAVESGSMSLQASRAQDRLSLDRLSIKDLGGASVEAQGEITPASRWGRVKLDAARLTDFAGLVARIAPSRASRLFEQRAEALSPAKVSLEARREGEPKGGDFPFDFLTADGEAGGSRFTLKVSDAPAPVSALGFDLTVDAADGGALLKQLGLKAPSSPLGRARAVSSATGRWETGFDAKVSGSLAGADFSWAGRFTPNASGPNDALLFGSANVKADSLLPALIAFRLASSLPGLTIPVDLSADLVLRGQTIAFPKLSGAVSGAKIAGALSWTPPAVVADLSVVSDDAAVAQAVAGEAPPAGGLSGEISVDRASLSALLAIGFGPPAASKAGVRWSEAKFADAVLLPLPGEVKLRIGALDLGDAGAARNFEARLRTQPATFELADFALDAGSARLTGRAELRRDGAIAALSGAIDVENLTLDRPALSGKIGLTMDLATTGVSPGALVAGLVGQGEARLAGLKLPRLDPGALERALAKAQAPDALIDETNVQHALSLELDKQSLALPDGAVPLSLSTGVLRIPSIALNVAQGKASVGGSYDLRTGEFRANAAFESTKTAKFWSAPTPQISVTISGSPDAPQRHIDDAGLVAGLAAQAVARDADRIAALEADLRERAAFNRRFKAEAFMDRRAAEIAAFEADQLRKSYEADRARVADALMKAWEEKRAADAAAAAQAAAAQAAAAQAAAAQAAAAQAAAAAKPPAPVVKPIPPGTPPTDPADPTANGLY